MGLHMMRVLPLCLTLLTGCVVPGGYHDGSKDPIMSEAASANAVYSATYESFCNYHLILTGSKIRCRGRIHLSDDGETLALVYRKTVDFVNIASGKKKLRPKPPENNMMGKLGIIHRHQSAGIGAS